MTKTTVNIIKVAQVPDIKNYISSIDKKGKKLKILHLEDVSSDAVLVNNQLKKSKLDYEILAVDTKAKFIKALKKYSPDIILADHSLPSFNSQEALIILKKTNPTIPFIVVTATMTDEFAADMIVKGADDYIIKDRLHRLPTAIHNALEKHRLQHEKEAMVDELKKSEARLKQAQSIANLGSWELDYSTGVAIWSDEQLKIYGLSIENNKQSYTTWTTFIHPEDLEYVLQKTNNTKATLKNSDFFHRIIRGDGTVRHLYSQTRVKFNKEGIPVGLYGVTQDVTERTEAEESLKKSEANLQAIFENTSDGFILTDINGIIKSFNSKARDRMLLNIEQEIAVGRSIYDFLPDARKKMYKGNILKVLSGKILQYDYPYTRKSGETKWFSFTINSVYTAGKIAGISFTSTDITERKKAAQQLKMSELFNKGILASLNSHIAVIDYKGNIITVNKAWDDFGKANGADSSLEGISTGSNYIEVCQRSMASGDIIAGQTLKGIQAVFNKEIKHFELEYPCHSLTEQRWFSLSVMNFGDDDCKVVIAHQNITQRKIAENKLSSTSNELQQTLTDLNKILDSSLDVICTINVNGEFVEVSNASQNVWGYAPEELIGTRFMNLVYAADADITLEAAEKIAGGIQVPIFENRYVHKNGRVVPILWSVNWDEKLQLMFCIAKDVTEKKRLEKAVENERDQFFDMFSKAPSAIGMLKGADHVFEMANHLYLQLTGKKDVIGKTVAEVLPEVIEQGFIGILDNVYRTGETYIGTEALVKVDKEGNGELVEFYMNFVYQAYRNGKGEIEGVFFFINEITEQILSRKKIEKSEKFFKGVIENIDDMITTIDTTGKTMYASPAVARKFGYTPAECLNLNIADIVHPDDLLIMQEFVGKIMMHPGVPMECPLIRDRKKDGSYIWVEGTLTNFLETEGINAIVANFRDVTERKKGDEENRFKANLLNTIGQAAIATDINGIVNYWNRAAENIYGWTKEEALGKYVVDLTTSEATNEQAIQIMEDLKKGQTWSGEFKVRKKDGTNFPALVTNSPLLDEHNRLTGIIGISSDITEIKKLEDLLEKTNRLAAVGSWEIDVIKGTVFWSDITKEIREVDKDYVPQLNVGLHYFKHSHSEIISQKVKECIENGTPWDEELQIITFKGNYKWVRTIGEGEYLNGKCIRIRGSFQDINNRKKAEIEVLKVYEEKNAILESIGDAFFAVDKDSVVTYWNKKAEIVMTKRRDEVIGKNIWDVFNGLLDGITYKNYQAAIKENKEQHYETFSEKLGKWLEISAYPSNNGLTGYFKDITERKLAENERVKISADLVQRNKDLEQFSYIISHNLRAPVANIIGLSSMLQKDNVAEHMKKEINIGLSTSVNKLDYVIRDLNSILTVRQQVNENKQIVNFSDLTHDIKLSINSIIVDKKAIIVGDFSEVDELLTIKSYLYSIFCNLISNSLKYQQPGIPPVIEIKSQQLNDKIILFFKDNGLGIDLQKRGDQVFGLYKRFHTQQAEGKGVGLYMVKTQVEAIGGNISITSEVNKGTAFKIEFKC